jgi:hypothetical protein
MRTWPLQTKLTWGGGRAATVTMPVAGALTTRLVAAAGDWGVAVRSAS